MGKTHHGMFVADIFYNRRISILNKGMIHSIDWKIVLVDDEKDIRHIFSIILSDAGFKVKTAPDAETGLSLCRTYSPHIVVTDIRLPGMDGLNLLEILKKQYPDIEVIVITAFGAMEPAARALKLDASDFVTKPVSEEAMMLSIKRAQDRYILKKQIQAGSQVSPEKPSETGTTSIASGTLYRKLVESSMDGALLCNEKEAVIALNSSMEQMLGFTNTKTKTNLTLGMLFPQKEKKVFMQEFEKEHYGGKNRLVLYEANLIDQSGKQIPVQMSAAMLSEKNLKEGMLFFFKDMRRKTILCDQWIQMIDQLNIGAFTIDLDRRITSFNSVAQALTGLKESNVIGKDCREVFSDVPCYVKCPCHVGLDRDTSDLPVEIFDQSDMRHLVTRLSAPLYGPGNKPSGCLTLLQDHAAFADLINRLNYEERSLKMILDNLDIGIFTINRGGHITFFNTASEIISGYNRRQVLGRHCTIIFGQKGIQDPTLLQESITLGESRTSNESVIITQEGETVPIRANYFPLHSDQGKIVGGLATIQDLTLAHQFKQVTSRQYTFHSMIGKSPAMQKIFKIVAVVAKSNATILVEGETGAGKDVLANVIHSAGRRSEKPLVKVNCAALPDNLLESEMFGYVKGAFTGADRNKPGRFQEADKGTLFLDEIGDLPLSLQAKLLRVLEDQEFYPLGGNRTVKVDVRIIAATNRPLEKLVKNRQFREDLFYRLNVIRFELPPLRKRSDDIPLLIRHLIRKLCSTNFSGTCNISKQALKILLNYKYPGNVRELQNILEHAIIVCQDNMIEPEHLPDTIIDRSELPNNDRNVYHQTASHDLTGPVSERDRIFRALELNDWNRKKTAENLGIDRTTLWRKMKKMEIH